MVYPDRDEVARRVGANIRKAREQKGIPRCVMEDRCGVGRGTIHRYETGENLPGFYNLLLMARELEMSLDELAGERGGEAV